MKHRHTIGPNSKPEQWKHGAACYANHGCRCDVCREGVRVYQREYQRTKRSTRKSRQRSQVTEERAEMTTWPELVARELDRLAALSAEREPK
jgi:hypothetical protein